MLVDGVTKLDKVTYGQAAQAETVRKMVVAMARDIRVLVIKLADRLHNARTWRYVSQESAQRKAKETLEIYAPLAHRLGMNTIKWELEDLSFQALYPKVYDEIVRLVAERAPAREEYLAGVREEVSADLRAAKIKATVTGRPKHYYSVYQKMIVGGRDFEQIYDLVAVRVLVETVRDCYAALGALHARWNPVPGRFKDYIAMPKFNMYQSLHTTVIGPGGKPVEIQIRTHTMHRRAEYGVAAHWKYKEDPGAKGTRQPGRRAGARRPDRRRQRHGVAAPAARLAEGDLRPGRVPRVAALRDQRQRGLRLHPQGPARRAAGRLHPGRLRLRRAHRGRPPLHRRPGQRPPRAAREPARQRRRRRGAHLQGRLRRPVARLAELRALGAGPQQDQALVHQGTPRGDDRRGQGLPRQGHAQAGPAAAAAHLRRVAHRRRRGAAPRRHRRPLRRHRRGQRLGPARRVAPGRLGRRRGGRERGHRRGRHARHRRRPDHRRHGDPGVVVKDMSDVWVKLARCCTPVPGDDILGFVTRGNGVSVHRRDCTNADSLLSQPEKIIEVEWAPTSGSVFLVQLQVEALDRSRLLSDVTRVISDNGVNILSAAVTTSRDRVAKLHFTFEMGDPAHLGHVVGPCRRSTASSTPTASPDRRRPTAGPPARRHRSDRSSGTRRRQPPNSSSPARAWVEPLLLGGRAARGRPRPPCVVALGLGLGEVGLDRRRRTPRAGRRGSGPGPRPRGWCASSAARRPRARRSRPAASASRRARGRRAAPCRPSPTGPGCRAAAPWRPRRR